MSTYFDSPKIIFNEKSIDVTTPHFQRLHVSIKLKTVTLNNTFKYSDKIVLLNNIQSKSKQKHLNSKNVSTKFNIAIMLLSVAGRGAGKKYKHSFIATIPKSAPLGSRERAGAAPCLTDCLL